MSEIDQTAMAACRAHWKSIAKPLYSLGLLEDAIEKIAGIQGRADVRIDRRCVLVFCADNGVVTGRYAIARFALQTTGRPSHAGARLADGRSAIREMARRIVEIEEMTTPDCTFSVGVIHGGQWVNCVPIVKL